MTTHCLLYVTDYSKFSNLIPDEQEFLSSHQIEIITEESIADYYAIVIIYWVTVTVAVTILTMTLRW